ncbi:MAG TPA: UDP-N-acetylmuramoyl-tripeptide--D-alanyl-D-alanine ligase, partial [Spirochaetota bacterium]|nr:UDP-N-acetylmuramoyl-tripeptide--D-alanyl-D-alanine ligase [Spirochaetota bacterium]
MKEKVIFTAGEIVSAVGGKLIKGNSDMAVSSVTTDSRMSEKEDLFVPLKGEKFDGHDFIGNILSENRLKGFLYSSSNSIPEIPDDCFAIEVKDTLYALGRLASFHRKRVHSEVIGITGTNGKTTTKELIAQIFSLKYKTLKSEKNYNNEVGVPFTLFRLSQDDKYAVIEIGMNHIGEISRLSSYAQPDSALITNAGEGHLEFLGTVENVAKAKSEIMEPMKKGSFIFLNKDSEAFNVMESRAQKSGLKLISFGLKNADISPDNFKLSADRIDYTLMGKKY